MTCNDFDSLLCDYLDGRLVPERQTMMEIHLGQCIACAETTREARSALEWMERSADVDVPPELVTKILQQIPREGLAERLSQGLFAPVFRPFLQPRLVMGAMLTILSLSMMTRCAGAPKHALTASDLDPVRIWGSFDDKIHRGWERSVKTYESMKLVYEVQSRVQEWKEKQQEDEQEAKRLPGRPDAQSDAAKSGAAKSDAEASDASKNSATGGKDKLK